MNLARLNPARLVIALGVSLLLATGASAGQQRIGDYTVYYGAVSTAFLTPDVAREYRVQRSPALGLLSVSVREHLDDGTTRHARINVKGSVGPLKEPPQPLEFRTVRSEGAVTELATFRLQHDVPLHFTLRMRTDRNAEPETVRFIQRFYIED